MAKGSETVRNGPRTPRDYFDQMRLRDECNSHFVLIYEARASVRTRSRPASSVQTRSRDGNDADCDLSSEKERLDTGLMVPASNGLGEIGRRRHLMCLEAGIPYMRGGGIMGNFVEVKIQCLFNRAVYSDGEFIIDTECYSF